jgi:hypothetical protein
MVAKKQLLVEILSDASRMRQGVEQATKQLGVLSKAASSAGDHLRKALGVGAAVALGKQLFDIGVKSEAMGARYRAVFGENTAALDTWVQAHHREFGVAQDDIQGYLAEVANMLVPLGMTTAAAGEQATEILEYANAWSIWSGGEIAALDAADKLVKGMLGQTRGLMDLGLNAKAVARIEEDLGEETRGLTGDALAAAEAQARWKRIMEQSGPAMQVFDEAMAGGAGTQRSLAAAFDTIKDSLGDLLVALAPILETLTGPMNVLSESVKSLGMGFSHADENAQLLADVWSRALVGSAEEAAATAKTLREEIGVVAQFMGMDAAEQTAYLVQHLDEAREAYGQVTTAVQTAVDILTGPLDQAFGDAATSASEAVPAADEYTAALQRQRQASEELYEAEKNRIAQQRAAIDPAFALIDADNKLREARRKYAEALAAGDFAVQLEALREAALAQADYNKALEELQTGPAVGALEELLRQAGYTEDQIASLIRQILAYNAVEVETKRFRQVLERFGESSTAEGDEIPFLQHGGQVTRTGLAVVHEGERVVPAAASAPAAASPLPAGGPLHIHLEVNGRQIAEAIVSDVTYLQDRQRRSRS